MFATGAPKDDKGEITLKILIARQPLQDSWLTFPYFYEKAARELGEFAQVDDIVIHNPKLPLGENVDLSPYEGVVVFGVPFTEACLAQASRLRIAAGFATGEEVLQCAGIPFIELGGAFRRSVAELGIGLTLSCLRNIAMWHCRVQAGHETWIQHQFTDDPNFVNGELFGKRVGVFGLGRIGQYYAGLAKAFGADLAATDPHVSDEVFAQLGVARMELDDLLSWSQIFVIASSPTPESEGIINRERVYKLSAGSCLIVISRAWPLDMQAVRDRVAAGEICGGFDVFDVEPLPPDDVLRRAPQVTLTPHVAGRCADACRHMAEVIVEAFREELTK